jgi:hypothetical protein
MTAEMLMAAIIEIVGARTKTTLSALPGTRSSLKNALTASENG